MIALPIKYDSLLKIRFISTTVDSEFPKGVTKVGETSSSKPSYVGPYPVYEGNQESFKQQVCNEKYVYVSGGRNMVEVNEKVN